MENRLPDMRPEAFDCTLAFQDDNGCVLLLPRLRLVRAQDEITRLLAPKVLTNFKRYVVAKSRKAADCNKRSDCLKFILFSCGRMKAS